MNALVRIDQGVTVHHIALPFNELGRGECLVGETVEHFLERCGWTFKTPTICVMNGQPLRRADWSTTIILDTDEVYFLSRPWGGSGGGGGGGKLTSVIGIVALIGLTLIAGPIASGLLGSTLASTVIFGSLTYGSLLATGIVMAGSFLLSTLIAPKAGGLPDPSTNADSTDQVYSLNASGNQARALNTIPVQYGKVKSFPDYASAPWSEYVGADQYLNLLFVLGMGKYHLHQIFLDDTLLVDENTGLQPGFTDVTYEQYNPGETVDLFPANVTSAVEVTGQELTQFGSNWLGPFTVNSAGTQVNAIAFDVGFPAGLFQVNEAGGLNGAYVTLIGQVRQINDAGTPISDWFQVFTNEYGAAARTPLRFTLKVDVAPAGRYEARLQRNIETSESNTLINNTAWLGLRGFLVGDTVFDQVSILALRIKASSQLSGASSKKIGFTTTRILEIWNGSSWVEEATRNPLWAFWDAATNADYGAKRPPSKVDIGSILAEATAAEVRGDTFNYVFNSSQPVPKAFDIILAVARCKHRWSGDVLTLVRDAWQAVPQMLLTDRQIVRGTTTLNYIFNDDEANDSVILEYLDESTWGPQEVQFPPNTESFNSVNPARIRLDGVTNRDHAIRECAFFYRQAFYRRIKLSLDTEHDGRVLGILSTIRVQTELPQSWGSSGEIVDSSGLTVTLYPIPASGAGQAYINIRTPHGKAFGPIQASIVDDVATLNSGDVATVETQLGITLADAIAREEGGEPATYDWGYASAQSRICKVLGGRPNGDKVSLTLVVDREEVHDTGLDTIPDIPNPPPLVDPSVPVITGLTGSFRQGQLEPIIDVSWWPSPAADYYVSDVSYDAGLTWTRVYQGNATAYFSLVRFAEIRVRVAGIGSQHGFFATIDISPEQPVLAPGTVTVESMIEAVQERFIGEFDRIIATMQKYNQIIANAAAEQDAANNIEAYRRKAGDYNVRVLAAAGDAAVQASVTELSIAFTDAQGAFAEYQLVVDARFDAAEANITTTASALATLEGSFATYQVAVDARFDTAEASIVTNATAIATLNTSFSTFQTTVNSHFATNDAAIALNATTLATQSLSIGSLTSSVTARVGGPTMPNVAVTISIATPAVFAKTAHGLTANTAIVLHTNGALPPPLAINTIYYVSSSGLTANSFRVSLTPGGPTINTTDTQSGVHSYEAIRVVSISSANPAVVTNITAGAGPVVNELYAFYPNAGGTLPAPLVAGTFYYVLSTGLTLTQYRIAYTSGGTAISTLGASQSGTFYARKLGDGTLQASITEQSLAIADLEGTVTAIWSLKLDVEGRVSGMIIEATAEESNFIILSDNFYIASPSFGGGSPIVLFAVESKDGSARFVMNGQVWISSAIIGKLQVNEIHIEGASITVSSVSFLTVNTPVTSTSYITLFTGSLTIPNSNGIPFNMLIIMGMASRLTAGVAPNTIDFRVLIDGVPGLSQATYHPDTVSVIGNTAIQASIFTPASANRTYNFTVQARALAAGSIMQADSGMSLAVLGFIR
jgi:hypothetical protein